MAEKLTTFQKLAEMMKDGDSRIIGGPIRVQKLKSLEDPNNTKSRSRVFGSARLAARRCGITPPVTEHKKWHSKRQWRFDMAWPHLKIAVEYEGLFSEKSRHTNPTGYNRDSNKYNEAHLYGWIVLRYTAMSPDTLIHDQLRRAFDLRTLKVSK